MTRATAMHHINNVLFQIEFDYYRNTAARTPQQQQQQIVINPPLPSPSTSFGNPSSSSATFENSSPYPQSMSPLQQYVHTFADL